MTCFKRYSEKEENKTENVDLKVVVHQNPVYVPVVDGITLIDSSYVVFLSSKPLGIAEDCLEKKNGLLVALDVGGGEVNQTLSSKVTCLTSSPRSDFPNPITYKVLGPYPISYPY